MVYSKLKSKKIEKFDEKFKDIFENANDLITIINQNFECEYSNENDYFFDNEKTPLTLIEKDVFKITLESLRKGFNKYETNEMRIKIRENQFLWFENKGNVYIDTDGKRKAIIISKDITERKKAEQVLKEKVKKYREAYNYANFYRDLVAHDLNNILNNVGTAEELISLFLNVPENLNDIKRYLEIIKDQIKRGSELISKVQKLSQLEENEISIKSLEVCKLLKDAMQFTYKSFQTRNINIQIDSIGKRLFVQANDLLLDVFENILNNAVKFNDKPHIELLIIISKIQKKGIKYIKFEFLDNGIGIPDDRKDTIFQRDHEKEQSIQGMGLGLSLVKKIIEIYKGEIWIENKAKGDYSKGSNFILLIPEVI